MWAFLLALFGANHRRRQLKCAGGRKGGSGGRKRDGASRAARKAADDHGSEALEHVKPMQAAGQRHAQPAVRLEQDGWSHRRLAGPRNVEEDDEASDDDDDDDFLCMEQDGCHFRRLCGRLAGPRNVEEDDEDLTFRCLSGLAPWGDDDDEGGLTTTLGELEALAAEPSAATLEVDLVPHRTKSGEHIVKASERNLKVHVRLTGAPGEAPPLQLQVGLVRDDDCTPVTETRGEPALTGSTSVSLVGGKATLSLKVHAQSYYHRGPSGNGRFRLQVQAARDGDDDSLPVVALSDPFDCRARLPDLKAAMPQQRPAAGAKRKQPEAPDKLPGEPQPQPGLVATADFAALRQQVAAQSEQLHELKQTVYQNVQRQAELSATQRWLVSEVRELRQAQHASEFAEALMLGVDVGESPEP